MGHEKACDGAIFVAGILSDEVTMRFLGAEQEIIGTAFIHEPSNPFETDMDVPFASNTVRLGDFACQFAGDQGFDDVTICRQIADLFAFRQHKIGEESTELIAIEGRPWAVWGGC